jgi:hypothetical protein
MRAHMRTPANSLARRLAVAGTLALAACALVAPTVLAFHKHLTAEQVREAYFMGRDQNHRDAFFAAYTDAPQMPKSGPYFQSIEFWTPYEQVALRARDADEQYFPPDAEQDYLVNPIREIIVRVRIFETYSFYFSPADEDSPYLMARLFKYRVLQDGRDLPSAGLTARLDNSLVSGSGTPSFAGIDVRLHFDVSRFKSSDPVTVEITTPSGQTYSTTFDVAQLK